MDRTANMWDKRAGIGGDTTGKERNVRQNGKNL